MERQKRFLVKLAFWAAALMLSLLVLRYALVWLLPFLLGFLIAYLLRPVARFITGHSGMGKRCASIVSAVILYAVLGLLLWLAGLAVAGQVERAAQALPRWYDNTAAPALEELGQKAEQWTSRLGMGASSALRFANSALGSAAQSASQWGMRLLGSVAGKVPIIAIALIFTILSSVMICMDYEQVTAFVMRQLPAGYRATLLGIRDFLLKTIGRVCWTYLLLMLITFAELAAGLWLLQVGHFLLAAVLIALLDTLPVLGSGVALVPWAVWKLSAGDHVTGWGLLALWVVVSVVRQVLEPKILGDQIGLPPLAALTAMYVGLRVAGVWGLVFAPVLCLLLRYLHDNNIVRLYK